MITHRRWKIVERCSMYSLKAPHIAKQSIFCRDAHITTFRGGMMVDPLPSFQVRVVCCSESPRFPPQIPTVVYSLVILRPTSFQKNGPHDFGPGTHLFIETENDGSLVTRGGRAETSCWHRAENKWNAFSIIQKIWAFYHKKCLEMWVQLLEIWRLVNGLKT